MLLNRSVKSGDVGNYDVIPRVVNIDVHGQKMVDILVKARKRRGQGMKRFTLPLSISSSHPVSQRMA